ncbi:Uncharacterized protein dnm_002230 [Desulfonema magnum]|uniref:Uncharacterized protein n=1 Tax=Desulfonema magnum TaxID=45655 RepID=A0A975BEH2_9BACT|nr:Uncharacterized protein dnm_002230 [Desulfonema magnum]
MIRSGRIACHSCFRRNDRKKFDYRVRLCVFVPLWHYKPRITSVFPGMTFEEKKSYFK